MEWQVSLSIYGFGHNLNKIRYPWQESLRSALDLVGDNGLVFFAECDSDDGTWEDVKKLARQDDRLVLLQHPWGNTNVIQAHIANFLLDNIGVQTEYALKIDMDEVLHEDSFDEFREDLDAMSHHGLVLGRPQYTHFCPDFWTTWPFIYESKAVLSRTDRGLRFNTRKVDDACALGGAQEYQTRLHIYHYGKCQTGREMEAIYKEWTFQQLYVPADIGFPDPRIKKQWEAGGPIDYMEIFAMSREKGEFKPFTGKHPRVMEGYIKEAEKRSRKFWEQYGKT